MNSIHAVADPTTGTDEYDFSPSLSAATALRAHTNTFGSILTAHELCIRVTVEGHGVVIGDYATLTKTPVEFAFDSSDTFVRLFRDLRLFDFAMAYIDGQMKIIGSIVDAVQIIDILNGATDRSQTAREYCQSLLFRAGKYLFRRKAMAFESLNHYALNAKAYELFLDDYMQYTCGHFVTNKEDINRAQVAKFELIAELVSKYAGSLAGKDHLDIGCGWGGMIGFFAKNFRTRSIGNTNCKEQMEYAQRRYNCEIVLSDFSKLKNSERRFDFITIVGMIEHLTPSRRMQLLKVVHHLLRDRGVVYLQCIAKPPIWIGGDAYRVAQKEVFPGHFLETPEQTDARLQRSGFTVLDRFDDCADYGLTTSRWVDNLQRNEARFIDIVDARRYRMYLGYLAFASRMFSSGRGSLLRYVLVKH
jgi:cyclopropane fatty-acyl-phospholipid synthase-like methyltransferase